VNYVRFNSIRETPQRSGVSGPVDPTNLEQFGLGKLTVGVFGTPFDLGELRGCRPCARRSLASPMSVDLIFIGDGNTLDTSGGPDLRPGRPRKRFRPRLDVDGVGRDPCRSTTGEVVIDFETLGEGLVTHFRQRLRCTGWFHRERKISTNNDYNSPSGRGWSGWAKSAIDRPRRPQGSPTIRGKHWWGRV